MLSHETYLSVWKFLLRVLILFPCRVTAEMQACDPLGLMHTWRSCLIRGTVDPEFPRVCHLVNVLSWASRVTFLCLRFRLCNAKVVITAPASLAVVTVEWTKDHTATEWKGFSQALCWYLSSLFRGSAPWCFTAPIWVRRADTSLCMSWGSVWKTMLLLACFCF